ncbi:MAG TPA: PQQ-dependent sugar dehydrogenase [Candidatus Thermoplasmatota archaeon]|nr:PQQ-dependent sugar dehydrogenase [Candidatus Thermoplasmatota archaeon]
MRAFLLVAVLALALAPAPASAQDTETEIASLEEGAAAEVAYTGLTMPVDIAFGTDGTLYYASFESGELKAVAADGSERVVWTAPDLQLGGERGFVGLAVAPDGGSFYVFYQTNKSGTVVSRLSQIVDGQENVLLDDIKSEKLHNSGRIAFGPDGLMYVSVGDAVLDTAGRQKSMHAHDPMSLNGKVLRLNADGTPAAGNPWGNEVWTKGHRNVYGLAVSPANVVLATENGPESWDEINLLVGGNDYGWPTCSGACDQDGFVDPILAYESTIAPTGAVWYEGAFFFTDFNKGSLHRVRQDQTGAWKDERVLKFSTPRILDVAVGPDGLYLSTWDSVWRVVPGPLPADTLVAATPPTSPTKTVIVTPSAEPTPDAAPTGTPPGQGAIGEANGIPGPGVWAYGLVALAALLRGRGSFK